MMRARCAIRRTSFCVFGVICGMLGATTTGGAEPNYLPSPTVSSPSAVSRSATSHLADPDRSDKEQKIMLNQFMAAQRTATLALDHRQRFELKALKESQRIQAKEWEKKERELRHQFFAAHSQGAVRREYIHTFIQRREEFYKTQSADKKRMIQEQEQKLKTTQQEHVAQFREFNRILKQGQKPSLELWPQE